MVRDLASLIRLYDGMVEEGLPYYDEEVEVTNLFVTRELVEDALRAGAEVTAADRARLDAADAKLLRRRRRLLRRFPELFEDRPADVPRVYWWWYLDEGPRVREEPVAGAKER
ncbi:MAG: hypothetical protein HY691_08635 [Chloroflexi bacterium]|nr:hypothetical protein [Chloroflexota bacterium]